MDGSDIAKDKGAGVFPGREDETAYSQRMAFSQEALLTLALGIYVLQILHSKNLCP